jgi:hypothetical protein
MKMLLCPCVQDRRRLKVLSEHVVMRRGDERCFCDTLVIKDEGYFCNHVIMRKDAGRHLCYHLTKKLFSANISSERLAAKVP